MLDFQKMHRFSLLPGLLLVSQEEICYTLLLLLLLLLLFLFTCTRGTYNCVPETNHVSRVYSIIAVMIHGTCDVISHDKRSVLLH